MFVSEICFIKFFIESYEHCMYKKWRYNYCCHVKLIVISCNYVYVDAFIFDSFYALILCVVLFA